MELPDFITDGPIGGQFPVNLYYEPDSSLGVPVLHSTPGTVSYYSYTSAILRQMLAHNDVLYFVKSVGSTCKLFSYSGSGVPTELGSWTVAEVYWASMAANFSNHIAVVDGVNTKIYVYDIDGPTWTAVNAPSGIVPTNITYLNSFGIIGAKSTSSSNRRKIYCSAIDDFTSWTSTDFASKEGRPDDVVCVMAVNQDLWVFGEDSHEIWYYTGASEGFPFARIGGGLRDIGCWAPASICVLDNSVFWLNSRGEVCRSVGYDWQVISPPQLNDEIQGYARASGQLYVSDAIGYTITWEGHPWYCLCFPTWGKTWVYDVAAAAAGQRGWFQWASGTYGRHISNCACYFLGQWRIGHYSSGSICSLSDGDYTDLGADRKVRKYAKLIGTEGKRILLHKFGVRGTFGGTATLTLYTGGVPAGVAAGSLTSPVEWSGLGSSDSMQDQPYIIYSGNGLVQIVSAYADFTVTRH